MSNCQLARFKSNNQSLPTLVQLYSTVCSSDNRSAENTAFQLSLSRDRSFVHKTPATENALSASTE